MAKAKYDRWLEPDGLILIEGWARSGLTELQISKNMGISASTLDKWKNEHVQILRALKKGKEVADFEIENALYKSATGFVGPDGKYYKPDTTAQIFWLKNRKPEQWRERVNVQTDDNDLVMQFIEEMKK